MHTLKEILTEPQTMYDGGVVGMAEGGQTPAFDKLDKRLQSISEATGSDKLRGSEVREYVEGIRRGEIDDQDFLRTYEATQKGLEHYTEEEVKSMGMEDPWLSPAIKRTTPESRKIREVLTETRGKVPLVELGLDPTRLVTSSLRTSAPGTYNPKQIDSRAYGKGVMEKQIAASDRPDLYDEGDYISAESGINPSIPTNTVIFHEAAHRGIEILERSTNFELPRLTKKLDVATATDTKEDLVHEHFNNELWVRLLEQKYYTPDTSEEKQKHIDRNSEYLRYLNRRGIIEKPDYPNYLNSRFIRKKLNEDDIKNALDYIRDSSRKELEERGFPKIKDDKRTSSFSILGFSRPTNMYDGGIVNMQDGGKPQNKLPVPKLLQTAVELGAKRHPVGMIARAIYRMIPKNKVSDVVKFLKDTPAHELFGLEQSGSQSLQKFVNDFTEGLQTQDFKAKQEELQPERNIQQPPRATVTVPKTMYDGGLV